MPTRLFLASSSPRRRRLLEDLQLTFTVIEPRGVDESRATGLAADRCRELALAKALAGLESLAAAAPGIGRSGAADEIQDCRVIGVDTLVVVGEGAGEVVIGKPRDRDDARRALEILSGRTHRVVSGVAVVRAGASPATHVETSEVDFRALAPREIEDYLDSGDADDKAGAYGIQSTGRGLVAGFRGCYTNIVGLPVLALLAMLPAEIASRVAGCDCAAHPLWRGGHGCGRRRPG